jgi:hypothetical protein
MKPVEVLADFFKGDIRIITIALEGEVYRVSNMWKLSTDKFENKKLKYFRIKSDNNLFVLAFNPQSMDWTVISKKKI